jgi:hypothetical protein
MSQKKPHGVYELKQYREYTLVFRDRVHAGDILARMLHPYVQDKHLVLGIPAGGVPVGVVVAETLHVPFDVAVVSKITLPWNTEAGYLLFDLQIKAVYSLIPLLAAEPISLTVKETSAFRILTRGSKFRSICSNVSLALKAGF